MHKELFITEEAPFDTTILVLGYFQYLIDTTHWQWIWYPFKNELICLKLHPCNIGILDMNIQPPKNRKRYFIKIVPKYFSIDAWKNISRQGGGIMKFLWKYDILDFVNLFTQKKNKQWMLPKINLIASNILKFLNNEENVLFNFLM